MGLFGQRSAKTIISIICGSIVRFGSGAASIPRVKVSLFYNDVYEVILPTKHGFPMQKYRLVREG